MPKKKIDEFRQGVIKWGQIPESTNSAVEEPQKLPEHLSEGSMGCRGRGHGAARAAGSQSHI